MAFGDGVMYALDPQTYREFCKEIRIPDGPYKGHQYDPDTEAPQKVLIDLLDGIITNSQGEPFREFAICWCTQAGKSLTAVLIPALYSVIAKGTSCVYCLPTADLLGKVWTDKLKPGIEDAGFGENLPQRGPGSKGGRPTSLPFFEPGTTIRKGSIIFVAGGSGKKREAGQAGVTAETVLIDEADEYEDAHRIALVRERASAFGRDATVIITSTVKKDTGSIILAYVEQGTGSRLWFQCPHCGRFQSLEKEGIKYSGTTEKEIMLSARYECIHCKVGWTESDRKVALGSYRLVHRGQTVDENGMVQGEMPDVISCGLTNPKADFAMGKGIPEMALEHYRAKRRIDIDGDHSLMRSYVRDRWSCEYRDADQMLDVDHKSLAVISSRSDYDKRNVPTWCDFLTIAVDVQETRIYWIVLGHCTEDSRSAIIDWGYEAICEHKGSATDDQLRETLDEIQELSEGGWQIQGSEERLIPARKGVDTGYKTEAVEQWAWKNGWCALKGAGRDKAKRMANTEKPNGTRIYLLRGWLECRRAEGAKGKVFHIDASNAKQSVHRGLLLPTSAPGSMALHTGILSNSMLALHLTAEIWAEDEKTGKWYWKEIRRRNDLLDCAAYALALGRMHIARGKRAAIKQTYGIIKQGENND